MRNGRPQPRGCLSLFKAGDSDALDEGACTKVFLDPLDYERCWQCDHIKQWNA